MSWFKKKPPSNFQNWHIAQHSRNGDWKVAGEDFKTICICADKEYALEIVKLHNKTNPIKSWEDWLLFRAK